MKCEMCGNQESKYHAEVEGTRMLLCESCSSFGKILGKIKTEKPKPKAKQRHTIPREEIIQLIKENAGQLIKQKRERLKLKQEQLAKQLSIKESLLHQIESGRFTPNIELARHIEKQLHIQLVEEHTEEHTTVKANTTESFTIGDLLRK